MEHGNEELEKRSILVLKIIIFRSLWFNYYPEMIFIHLSFILIRKQTDLSIHSVEISQPKTRENIQTKLNNI